jgi:hypothetical protein
MGHYWGRYDFSWNARNFVSWNKNRSKLSEFRSEPFRRRENNSESVPWNKNRSKHLEFCSEPFHSAEEKKNSENSSKLSEFRSEACLGRKHAVNSVCWSRIIYRKIFYSCYSVLFRASELTLPQTSECLGMSSFFRGITKTFPRNFFETKIRCQPYSPLQQPLRCLNEVKKLLAPLYGRNVV